MFAAGGVRGFWVGVGPNIVRNSVVNASEVASYDQYKEMYMKITGEADGLKIRMFCAFCAGGTACVVSSPVDVIKTRLLNASMGYTGFGNCITRIISEEGFGAFYAGFVPNFARLALFNIVCFVSFETIKDTLFA